MYDRQKLIDLIRQRALKFGDFTLASGQKSSYYLDGKQVTLHSVGLRQISLGLLDLLRRGVDGALEFRVRLRRLRDQRHVGPVLRRGERDREADASARA